MLCVRTIERHKQSLPVPETIAEIITEITSLSNEGIIQMGTRGRTLIERKYEQLHVASMMRELYEWLLNGEDKLVCVYE